LFFSLFLSLLAKNILQSIPSSDAEMVEHQMATLKVIGSNTNTGCLLNELHRHFKHK
jgi:hypothetical protein